jgi:AAA+ ATPase superfamily predicted ATPase
MPQERIFGREAEIKVLDTLWTSPEAEFLAIYGRRRVGKTYLIREYFTKKKCLYFEITGEKDGSLKLILQHFYRHSEAEFFFTHNFSYSTGDKYPKVE